MSDLVFPALPGVAIGIKKTSVWNTIVNTAQSLREVRIKLATSPVYNYELPYSFLRTPFAFQELQTLIGFINQVGGAYDSWLYSDPLDNEVKVGSLGIGDGTTTTFRLTRTYGGFTENIDNPNTATISAGTGLMWSSDGTTPMWSSDGTTPMWIGPALGSFTISNGSIIFATAPPIGVTVYWSGFFYYRCRFLNDANEFDQETVFIYSNQGLQFKGSLQSKI